MAPQCGCAYFIPRAYPHHIENIGSDPWHFLIFFDQPFTPAPLVVTRTNPVDAKAVGE